MSHLLAAALLSLAALSGCATLDNPNRDANAGAALTFDTPLGNTGDPSTLAKCQTADVVSTAIAFSMTQRTELNPFVNALAPQILGRVGGIIVGLTTYSWLIYEALVWLDKPTITSAATVLTCASAVRNVYVIGH